MYELIYFLTMAYTAYVIDDVKGEQIIDFLKNVFHLDLTIYHSNFRSLKNSIQNALGLNQQLV